jgi:hypothetical protein
MAHKFCIAHISAAGCKQFLMKIQSDVQLDRAPIKVGFFTGTLDGVAEGASRNP